MAESSLKQVIMTVNEFIITYHAFSKFSLLHGYYLLLHIITPYYMLPLGQLTDDLLSFLSFGL